MNRKRRKRVFYHEIDRIDNKFGKLKLNDKFCYNKNCTINNTNPCEYGVIDKIYEDIYQNEECNEKYLIYMKDGSFHDLNSLIS